MFLNTFARLLLLLGIMACTSCQKEPASPVHLEMKYHSGETNFVVSAPHGGYEKYTEEMARQIASELHWGMVVAMKYRDPGKQLWINVNRPTESHWKNTKRTRAAPTPRAQEVFKQYSQTLKMSCRGEKVELLVELHGNKRTVDLPSGREPLLVIELASFGFSPKKMSKLKKLYGESLEEVSPQVKIPLYIDNLDREFVYKDKKVPFKWKASQAKSLGVFQKTYIEKGLHLELPYQIRINKNLRRDYTRILIKTLGKWEKIMTKRSN